MYLWHWPLLVFAYYPPVNGIVSLPLASGMVALTFILAILSWKMIETPVRRKKILRDRNTLFITLFGLLLLCGVAGAGIAALGGVPSRFSPQVNAYAAGEADTNPRRDACTDPRARRSCAKRLLPPRAQGRRACFCAYGDSEADALMPLLDHMADKYGVAGAFGSYNSCPPVFGLGRANQPMSLDCRGFNDAVMKYVRDNHVKTLILSGRWYLYMGTYLSQDDGPAPQTVAESRVVFRRGLIAALKALRREGVKVWIVKSPPEYAFDVPRKLAAVAAAGGEARALGQPISARLALQVNIEPLFAEIRAYGVHFIDPADFLCKTGASRLCRIEKDGRPLYSDSHHLSAFGVLQLEPLFAQVFAGLKRGQEH